VSELRDRINPALWLLLVPEADRQYRWRVQLDCGCVEEVLTNDEDRFPDERKFYDHVGHAWLPPAEMWCRTDHGSPKPYRNIVEWVEREIREFPPDPEEDPWGVGAETWVKIRRTEPRSTAFWRVKLACGHYTDHVCTDVGWKPEDDPKLVTVQRAEEMRQECEKAWAEHPDAWPPEGIERDHMRKMLELRWPRPEPEQDCFTCSRVRRIIGYQRIGWLVPRAKPKTPPKPQREVIEARLRKAEAEAERLRRQLNELD
jgi:hypothetical protein